MDTGHRPCHCGCHRLLRAGYLDLRWRSQLCRLDGLGAGPWLHANHTLWAENAIYSSLAQPSKLQLAAPGAIRLRTPDLLKDKEAREYSQSRNNALPCEAGCQVGVETFIKMRPITINAAARTRAVLTPSPKTIMPTTNAPTAPMPVQIG